MLARFVNTDIALLDFKLVLVFVLFYLANILTSIKVQLEINTRFSSILVRIVLSRVRVSDSLCMHCDRAEQILMTL